MARNPQPPEGEPVVPADDEPMPPGIPTNETTRDRDAVAAAAEPPTGRPPLIQVAQSAVVIPTPVED